MRATSIKMKYSARSDEPAEPFPSDDDQPVDTVVNMESTDGHQPDGGIGSAIGDMFGTYKLSQA